MILKPDGSLKVTLLLWAATSPILVTLAVTVNYVLAFTLEGILREMSKLGGSALTKFSSVARA